MVRLKHFCRFGLFPFLWEIWEFLRCFISKEKLKIFGIWHHDTGKFLNTNFTSPKLRVKLRIYLKKYFVF